jgi:hypothetical protein
MIRVLVIIAVTGFLVSVVSFSAAIGIAGPEAVSEGFWNWDWDGPWAFDHHDRWSRHHRWDHEDAGPQTTREIAWTGGQSVDFDLPADVTYTQAPGPAKLVVTGARDDVADVEIEDGHVRLNDDHGGHDGDISIVMTAPSVNRFALSGSGKLAIANYKQDKLTVELPGSADFAAKGETQAIDLNIEGSANADLGALKARSAEVNIEGSGSATLAPSEAATIDISGSGQVRLLTHPPRLESHVSGSGEIVQEDGGATAPPATPGSKKGSRA